MRPREVPIAHEKRLGAIARPSLLLLQGDRPVRGPGGSSECDDGPATRLKPSGRTGSSDARIRSRANSNPDANFSILAYGANSPHGKCHFWPK